MVCAEVGDVLCTLQFQPHGPLKPVIGGYGAVPTLGAWTVANGQRKSFPTDTRLATLRACEVWLKRESGLKMGKPRRSKGGKS